MPVASDPRQAAIVGTTASGKSTAAMAVARQLGNVELVSADSMAIYRGMDLATAKASASDRAEIPHHLIDLCEPSVEFTVAEFQAAGLKAMAGIAERGKHAVLVGGSGLYQRSLVDQLEIPSSFPELRAALEARVEAGELPALYAELQEVDPEAASRIEPGNARRTVRALEVIQGTGRRFSESSPSLNAYPEAAVRQWGISFDPERVDEAIEARFAQWMEQGLLAEVEALLAAPEPPSRTAMQAAGYAELAEHLQHGLALEEAVERSVLRSRQLARRQWRWFRRDPRITWTETPEACAEAVAAYLGS